MTFRKRLHTKSLFISESQFIFLYRNKNCISFFVGKQSSRNVTTSTIFEPEAETICSIQRKIIPKSFHMDMFVLLCLLWLFKFLNIIYNCRIETTIMIIFLGVKKRPSHRTLYIMLIAILFVLKHQKNFKRTMKFELFAAKVKHMVLISSHDCCYH